MIYVLWQLSGGHATHPVFQGAWIDRNEAFYNTYRLRPMLAGTLALRAYLPGASVGETILSLEPPCVRRPTT